MLANLNDEEFSDELRESIWSDGDWIAFEGEAVVERAREVLTELRASISGQLVAYAGPDNSDWTIRAKRFFQQVELRLGQTRRAIKEHNRERTASSEAYKRKWATLAFTLAEELGRSDRAFVLDAVEVGDGLTVADWLPMRRAQKSRKEANSGEEGHETVRADRS